MKLSLVCVFVYTHSILTVPQNHLIHTVAKRVQHNAMQHLYQSDNVCTAKTDNETKLTNKLQAHATQANTETHFK